VQVIQEWVLSLFLVLIKLVSLKFSRLGLIFLITPQYRDEESLSLAFSLTYTRQSSPLLSNILQTHTMPPKCSTSKGALSSDTEALAIPNSNQISPHPTHTVDTSDHHEMETYSLGMPPNSIPHLVSTKIPCLDSRRHSRPDNTRISGLGTKRHQPLET
jgi:hypothetical protein